MSWVRHHLYSYWSSVQIVEGQEGCDDDFCFVFCYSSLTYFECSSRYYIRYYIRYILIMPDASFSSPVSHAYVFASLSRDLTE